MGGIGIPDKHYFFILQYGTTHLAHLAHLNELPAGKPAQPLTMCI